MKAEVEH